MTNHIERPVKMKLLDIFSVQGGSDPGQPSELLGWMMEKTADEDCRKEFFHAKITSFYCSINCVT